MPLPSARSSHISPSANDPEIPSNWPSPQRCLAAGIGLGRLITVVPGSPQQGVRVPGACRQQRELAERGVPARGCGKLLDHRPGGSRRPSRPRPATCSSKADRTRVSRPGRRSVTAAACCRYLAASSNFPCWVASSAASQRSAAKSRVGTDRCGGPVGQCVLAAKDLGRTQMQPQAPFCSEIVIPQSDGSADARTRCSGHRPCPARSETRPAVRRQARQPVRPRQPLRPRRPRWQRSASTAAAATRSRPGLWERGEPRQHEASKPALAQAAGPPAACSASSVSSASMARARRGLPPVWPARRRTVRLGTPGAPKPGAQRAEILGIEAARA